MAERVVLMVHAHPDDECIGTGGALARYRAEGARTVLVTCTDGAVGEISDASLASPENLVEVRSAELDEAVRILGVSRLEKLGYRDSGMAGTADNQDPRAFLQCDFDEALEKVVRVVREEKPQVIVTYDENGMYGHPDHIRAHQVAVAAFAVAADASRFPSAGPAWTTSKLYYSVVPRSALLAFGERLRAAGIEAPFSQTSDQAVPFGVSDDRVTTVLDVSAYVDQKRRALQAHRTQMGPDQFFMRIPPEVFAEVFSRETFQRIEGPTAAEGTETDLFAGL